MSASLLEIVGGFCMNEGAGADETILDNEESDCVARTNLRRNSDDRPCLLMPAFAVVSIIAMPIHTTHNSHGEKLNSVFGKIAHDKSSRSK